VDMNRKRPSKDCPDLALWLSGTVNDALRDCREAGLDSDAMCTLLLHYAHGEASMSGLAPWHVRRRVYSAFPELGAPPSPELFAPRPYQYLAPELLAIDAAIARFEGWRSAEDDHYDRECEAREYEHAREQLYKETKS